MAFYQGYAPGMPGVGNTTYSRGRMIWAGLAGIQYLPTGGYIASAAARDPDNFESQGTETEPETPPTTSASPAGNLPTLPGAIATTYPTAAAPGYSGVLRAGLIMGKVGNQGATVTFTGTKGFYRPSILGLTTASITGATTSVTVTAQCAYEVARQISALGANLSLTLIGYDSHNSVLIYQAVTATAASGTTITTSSFTPGSSAVIMAYSFVCPADGAQYPVSFVDEQFGLNVVDNFGNSLTAGGATSTGASSPVSVAPFPRVPLAGGIVNVLNLINYPINYSGGSSGNYGTGNYSAAQLLTIQAWIKGNLNCGGQLPTSVTSPVNYGGKFNFTDDYGL